MVNWVPIVAAALAALPPAGVFFLAYGRYDGTFRDNVVFLYFIGGLVVGGFLGFFTLLLAAVTAPLVEVVGLALLYPIVLVAAINRRKWQGERHAVFNGGAAGLGAAVMLSFSLTYVAMSRPLQAAIDTELAAAKDAHRTAIAVNTAPYAFQGPADLQALLLSCALAGLLFGLGLLAGEAVRRKKQFSAAFIGTGIVLAPIVFLEELQHTAAWLWVLLLLAYGVTVGIVAERRLLPEALEADARRRRRRARRAARED